MITLEGQSLDDRGMLVDFTDIKRFIAGWIDAHLDHRMILNAADPVVPFLQSQHEPLHLISENPTAENIAKLIYTYAQSQELPVVEVRLWETFKSHVSFRGDPPPR